MSLLVRGLTSLLGIACTYARDLELLLKLMNTTYMLIAWTESHDPDVKEVRFIHSFLAT